jgi:hypothetical protein
VQRVNTRFASSFAKNDDQSHTRWHPHEIRMCNRHPRAVAQTKHKRFGVTMPAFSNALRVHFAPKLTDTHADFNMEGCYSDLRNPNPPRTLTSLKAVFSPDMQR